MTASSWRDLSPTGRFPRPVLALRRAAAAPSVLAGLSGIVRGLLLKLAGVNRHYILNTEQLAVQHDFLRSFDAVHHALLAFLENELGCFGLAMPLHERIAYVRESSAWSDTETRYWQHCLHQRRQLLGGSGTQPSNEALLGCIRGLAALQHRLEATRGKLSVNPQP